MENRILNPEQIFGSITLLPESGRPTLTQLPIPPDESGWVVCDFFPFDAPLGNPESWGYDLGPGHLVDHHAPDARWERHISSGNLAVEWIRNHPSPNRIFVNHTDCDSVVSAGIVAGILPPSAEFEAAVIAADHTGEANEIADLLQSIHEQRDLEFSFDCLSRLLEGRALPEAAQRALDQRVEHRADARILSKRPLYVSEKVVTFEAEDQMEAELLAGLVPEGWVMLLSVPHPHVTGHRSTRVRLTPHAPAGLSLHSLPLIDIIPGYGGRWNAGSNKRSGGSAKSMDVMAREIEGIMRP